MKTFEDLLAGYARFRENEWNEHKARWEQLSQGQEPRFLLIACSDSRTDPAQVFDTAPGEIFVIRNIAALVPPFETTPGQHGVSSALEFAVQFLRVEEILVMGHGLCGGCHAALTQSLRGTEPGKGGFVAEWIGMLDDVREPIARDLGTDNREAELAMEFAAVRKSLENLRTFPCVREKEVRGTLKLRGMHFEVSNGVLDLLDETTGVFSPA